MNEYTIQKLRPYMLSVFEEYKRYPIQNIAAINLIAAMFDFDKVEKISVHITSCLCMHDNPEAILDKLIEEHLQDDLFTLTGKH